MATEVILPALGIAQESGKIIRWLKHAGEDVTQGEVLAEIETDKASVEIQAPASGTLATIVAAGTAVPVGQAVALILAPGERGPLPAAGSAGPLLRPAPDPQAHDQRPAVVAASLLASRIAADRGVDLSQVRTGGQRVQKADVLAYLQDLGRTGALTPAERRLVAASPKARRLALVQGRDLATIKGSGPEGAVLAADVLTLPEAGALGWRPRPGIHDADMGTIWRVMAERTAHSWATVPHFYLTREVEATRLVAWRRHLVTHQAITDVSYTDLLVKIVAAALRLHPRLNATWADGRLTLLEEINIGLAVAIEEGLVVPVLHQADALTPGELARQRKALVTRAHAGKLRLPDISGGTFTISNLGMYGVDAFHAVINEPQAAILAVGRVAERVVARKGQPTVLPMLVVTLACDHRAVDGARAAQFLDTVASLIEEPLNLLEMYG